MPLDDDSKRLNYEIHAAIHSMLGGNIKDLLWTSVGLLSEVGKIVWDSCVNDEYDGQVTICDEATSELPCKDETKPLKCTPKTSPRQMIAPPCLKDNIDNYCGFREQLSGRKNDPTRTGLEQQTMVTGSLSMAELSKKYFIEKRGAHPYITIDSPEGSVCSKHPWITAKESVLSELYANEVDEKKGGDAAKEYARLASLCMPGETTAVLIPLVQAHGENNHVYIGAIVVCAKKENGKGTDIWEHLPRMKATALSLAEVYKHLYGMTENIQKNIISTFLDLLIKYGLDNTWFKGTCNDSCATHKNKNSKDRHESECRLICGGMGDFFTEKNLALQKSLFATKAFHDSSKIGVDNFSKVESSYTVPVKQVIDFLERPEFGIGHVEKPSLENFAFVWPTSPGLISFISLLDIYKKLNDYPPGGEPNTPKSGVLEIRIERYEGNKTVVFSIVFKLATLDGAKDLAAKWSGIQDGGRNTTNAIKSGMAGIVDKQSYNYDLRRGNLLIVWSEKFMAQADVPIFYPVFYKDELRLTWIADTSDTVKNDTSNLT